MIKEAMTLNCPISTLDVLKAFSTTKVAEEEREPKILPWLNALPLLPRLPNTDSVSFSKPNFEKTSIIW